VYLFTARTAAKLTLARRSHERLHNVAGLIAAGRQELDAFVYIAIAVNGRGTQVCAAQICGDYQIFVPGMVITLLIFFHHPRLRSSFLERRTRLRLILV
jgi:hypothetical protein